MQPPSGKYVSLLPLLQERERQLQAAVEAAVEAYSAPTALRDFLEGVADSSFLPSDFPYPYLAVLLFYIGNGHPLERYVERINDAILAQPDELTRLQLPVLTIGWKRALDKQSLKLSPSYRMWKKQLLRTTGPSKPESTDRRREDSGRG